MATMKGVLHPEEEEVVEKLYNLVSDGLKEMGKIWGEHPYLQRGSIRFEQIHNKVIPVVEIYCVLGGQYRNGTFYEASRLAQHPGWYSYDHRRIRYRLIPSTWRKPIESRLAGLLKNLIVEESDKIPSVVSKLFVTEGPCSLHMLCFFTGNAAPKLALAFTPALEGSGWPERFEGSARVSLAGQTAEHSKPICLLVQPFGTTGLDQGWELAFPNIAECILKIEDMQMLQVVLITTWLSEVRNWNKMGLRNPAIFQMIVFNLAVRDYTFPVGLRDQLKLVLTELRQSIIFGTVSDVCVPEINYLKGVTKEQQNMLKREVDSVLAEVEHSHGLTELYHEYPLLKPEYVPQDSDSLCNSCKDSERARATADACSLMLEIEEMDEGGGGEGCLKVSRTPPPLDAKELESGKYDQDQEENQTSQQGSSNLTSMLEEWNIHQNGRMVGTVLEVILIAVLLIVALREIGSLIDCISEGNCNGAVPRAGHGEVLPIDIYDQLA